MGLDLLVAYRLMVCVRELGGSANVTQLIRCAGSSASTVTKYVRELLGQGLLEEVVGGRGRRVRLTRRGEDFLFLVGRALALLGEEV